MSIYDVVLIALGAANTVAVLSAAGLTMFALLFASQLIHATGPIRRATTVSITIGIVLTVIHHGLSPARMTASLSGVWDASLQTMLLQSDAGLAHGVRLVGLLLLAATLRAHNALVVGLAGSMLIVASFLFMGHTASHDGRAILVGALAVHLSVLTFWFGALGPLHLVVQREAIETAATVLQRFSAMAFWSVPMVFIAGLVMSLMLLSSWDDLLEPYGLLLMTKATLFALLMLLAALNKWRYTERIFAGEEAAAAAFRTVVVLEWIGIAIVIVVTSFMTGLFAPDG